MATHVRHEPQRHRFSAVVDGVEASLDYEDRAQTLRLTHTRVPPSIGGRGVAGPVGRHQRHPEVFFQPNQAGTNAVLHLQPLVLNLQVEIFFSEDVAITRRRIPSRFVFVFHQVLSDFAFQAAG